MFPSFKITKGPRTSFQSSALSQKHVENVIVFDQVSF